MSLITLECFTLALGQAYMQSMSLTYLLNQRALYLLHVGYRQVIHDIKTGQMLMTLFSLSFSVCMQQLHKVKLSVLLSSWLMGLMFLCKTLQVGQHVFLHYFYVTSVTHNEYVYANNKPCFVLFTSGFTALHLAAKNNHPECAKKLLQVIFSIGCELQIQSFMQAQRWIEC